MIRHVMGKVLSVIIRPFRNYNAGNRAQKRIKDDKPTPAPRHPSTVKFLEKTIGTPESKEASKIPDDHINRLKQVYVKSEDPTETDSDSKVRKLPQSRETVVDPEFGFMEPAIVPVGKITMRQALELLTRHHSDPSKWTSQIISKEYKLDASLTEQLLLFFRPYDKWDPPNKNEKKQSLQESVQTFVIPKPPLSQIK